MFVKAEPDDTPIATAVAVNAGGSSAPPLPGFTAKQEVDHAQLDNWLTQQSWPQGLISALKESSQSFPRRIWIVDNSGSMATEDGHRIVGEGENMKFVNCTRWKELGETVEYHAELSGRGGWPTEFRLLNNPNQRGCSQFLSVQNVDDVPKVCETNGGTVCEERSDEL